MIYNFGAYGHLLLSEFHAPHHLTSLPVKPIINCPGYAAREWSLDDSVVPVRGLGRRR